MMIKYLFYGGGSALVGGGLGMAVAGPFGAWYGAGAGGAFGLSACSAAITDELKIKVVSSLNGLIGEISRNCSNKLIESIDYAIRTTTNSANLSLQSFTTQIAYTIHTISTTFFGGLVGGGLYLIASNDLNSRCAEFPLGCNVLGISSTFLVGSITIFTIYNFYKMSSPIKDKPDENLTHQTVHALVLEKGLNLIGECKNPACKMNKKKVILSKGFGTFDIGKVSSNFLCGKCATQVSLDTVEVTAKSCKFSYHGWDNLGTERKQDLMLVSQQKVPNHDWEWLEVVTQE